MAVIVAGANAHDMTLVEATLEALAIERPEPTDDAPQHFCADKGYDYDEIRDLVYAWGYTAHIRQRGEEVAGHRTPGYRARRWVVERTHSWMNRFRRLLIRFCGHRRRGHGVFRVLAPASFAERAERLVFVQHGVVDAGRVSRQQFLAGRGDPQHAALGVFDQSCLFHV